MSFQWERFDPSDMSMVYKNDGVQISGQNLNNFFDQPSTSTGFYINSDKKRKSCVLTPKNRLIAVVSPQPQESNVESDLKRRRTFGATGLKDVDISPESATKLSLGLVNERLNSSAPSAVVGSRKKKSASKQVSLKISSLTGKNRVTSHGTITKSRINASADKSRKSIGKNTIRSSARKQVIQSIVRSKLPVPVKSMNQSYRNLNVVANETSFVRLNTSTGILKKKSQSEKKIPQKVAGSANSFSRKVTSAVGQNATQWKSLNAASFSNCSNFETSPSKHSKISFAISQKSGKKSDKKSLPRKSPISGKKSTKKSLSKTSPVSGRKSSKKSVSRKSPKSERKSDTELVKTPYKESVSVKSPKSGKKSGKESSNVMSPVSGRKSKVSVMDATVLSKDISFKSFALQQSETYDSEHIKSPGKKSPRVMSQKSGRKSANRSLPVTPTYKESVSVKSPKSEKKFGKKSSNVLSPISGRKSKVSVMDATVLSEDISFKSFDQQPETSDSEHIKSPGKKSPRVMSQKSGRKSAKKSLSVKSSKSERKSANRSLPVKSPTSGRKSIKAQVLSEVISVKSPVIKQFEISHSERQKSGKKSSPIKSPRSGKKSVKTSLFVMSPKSGKKSFGAQTAQQERESNRKTPFATVSSDRNTSIRKTRCSQSVSDISPPSFFNNSFINVSSTTQSLDRKAEKAARIMKLKTPKSLDKNKRAALFVCHRKGQSSTKKLNPKKPLFSDIVKAKPAVKKTIVKPNSKPSFIRKVKKTLPVIQNLTKMRLLGSTGHANSPDPIIIRKTQVPTSKVVSKSVSQVVNQTHSPMSRSSGVMSSPGRSEKKNKSSVVYETVESVSPKEKLGIPLKQKSALSTGKKSLFKSSLKVNFNLSADSRFFSQEDTLRPMRTTPVRKNSSAGSKEKSEGGVKPSRVFLDALKLSSDNVITPNDSPTVRRSSRNVSSSNVNTSTKAVVVSGNKRRSKSPSLDKTVSDSEIELKRKRNSGSLSFVHNTSNTHANSSRNYRRKSNESVNSIKENSHKFTLTCKSSLNESNWVTSLEFLNNGDGSGVSDDTNVTDVESELFITTTSNLKSSTKKIRNTSFAIGELSGLDDSSFDFNSVLTPNVSTSMLVSPLSVKKSGTKTPNKTSTPKLHGSLNKTVNTSSYTKRKTASSGSVTKSASTLKKNFKNNKNKTSPYMKAINNLLNTPKSYLDVSGAKQLVSTPKSLKDKGIKTNSAILMLSKLNNSGIKKQSSQVKTPRSAKSSNLDVSGVKQLVQSPISSNLTGTKVTNSISPRSISPKFGKSNERVMRSSSETPMSSKLTSLYASGVKNIVETPLLSRSESASRRKSPKSQTSSPTFNVSRGKLGVVKASPSTSAKKAKSTQKVSNSNAANLRTPKPTSNLKTPKSCKSNYLNVSGIKELLKTPKTPNSEIIQGLKIASPTQGNRKSSTNKESVKKSKTYESNTNDKQLQSKKSTEIKLVSLPQKSQRSRSVENKGVKYQINKPESPKAKRYSVPVVQQLSTRKSPKLVNARSSDSFTSKSPQLSSSVGQRVSVRETSKSAVKKQVLTPRKSKSPNVNVSVSISSTSKALKANSQDDKETKSNSKILMLSKLNNSDIKKPSPQIKTPRSAKSRHLNVSGVMQLVESPISSNPTGSKITYSVSPRSISPKLGQSNERVMRSSSKIPMSSKLTSLNASGVKNIVETPLLSRIGSGSRQQSPKSQTSSPTFNVSHGKLGIVKASPPISAKKAKSTQKVSNSNAANLRTTKSMGNLETLKSPVKPEVFTARKSKSPDKISVSTSKTLKSNPLDNKETKSPLKMFETSRNYLEDDNENKNNRSFKKEKSPKLSYTDLRGVKNLLKTPKSPKSTYLNVTGVKQLLRTPQRSPRSNYLDVRGVKGLFSIQGNLKSSYEDVTGVKELFCIQRSSKSSYKDVTGVKELFSIQGSSKSSYKDVTGVKELFCIPGSSNSSYEDVTGVKELLHTPSEKPNKKIIKSRKLSLNNSVTESAEDLETAADLNVQNSLDVRPKRGVNIRVKCSKGNTKKLSDSRNLPVSVDSSIAPSQNNSVPGSIEKAVETEGRKSRRLLRKRLPDSPSASSKVKKSKKEVETPTGLEVPDSSSPLSDLKKQDAIKRTSKRQRNNEDLIKSEVKSALIAESEPSVKTRRVIKQNTEETGAEQSKQPRSNLKTQKSVSRPSLKIKKTVHFAKRSSLVVLKQSPHGASNSRALRSRGRQSKVTKIAASVEKKEMPKAKAASPRRGKRTNTDLSPASPKPDNSKRALNTRQKKQTNADVSPASPKPDKSKRALSTRQKKQKTSEIATPVEEIEKPKAKALPSRRGKRTNTDSSSASPKPDNSKRALNTRQKKQTNADVSPASPKSVKSKRALSTCQKKQNASPSTTRVTRSRTAKKT